MEKGVFSRIGQSPTGDPAVFKTRRLSDSVGPLNEQVHDQARLMTQAIAMLDAQGIEVISASVAKPTVSERNPSILVIPTRACAHLQAACVQRNSVQEKWVAQRFGCEITWYLPTEKERA